MVPSGGAPAGGPRRQQVPSRLKNQPRRARATPRPSIARQLPPTNGLPEVQGPPGPPTPAPRPLWRRVGENPFWSRIWCDSEIHCHPPDWRTGPQAGMGRMAPAITAGRYPWYPQQRRGGVWEDLSTVHRVRAGSEEHLVCCCVYYTEQVSLCASVRVGACAGVYC